VLEDAEGGVLDTVLEGVLIAVAGVPVPSSDIEPSAFSFMSGVVLSEGESALRSLRGVELGLWRYETSSLGGVDCGSISRGGMNWKRTWRLREGERKLNQTSSRPQADSVSTKIQESPVQAIATPMRILTPLFHLKWISKSKQQRFFPNRERNQVSLPRPSTCSLTLPFSLSKVLAKAKLAIQVRKQASIVPFFVEALSVLCLFLGEEW
jgi:hypothetical protein